MKCGTRHISSVRLGKFENRELGDTVLFLDTGMGTKKYMLINKHGI